MLSRSDVIWSVPLKVSTQVPNPTDKLHQDRDLGTTIGDVELLRLDTYNTSSGGTVEKNVVCLSG